MLAALVRPWLALFVAIFAILLFVKIASVDNFARLQTVAPRIEFLFGPLPGPGAAGGAKGGGRPGARATLKGGSTLSSQLSWGDGGCRERGRGERERER